MICRLCPRNCGVDRSRQLGYCGAPDTAVVARAELHFWEEPYLTANGASGAVFFSGCNLKCAFCQNQKISFCVKGNVLDAKGLADVFREIEDEGADNVDLITPTPYVPTIKAALDLYRPALPIIYNCGGYESAETIRSLKGYVDVYLPDYKYYDNALAKKYSGAADYRERCEEALLEMRKQVKDEVKDGVLKRGLAIRHLVLPTHAKDSFKVLSRIKELFGAEIHLSIMGQYVPFGDLSRFPELQTPLKPLEYKAVISHALSLGFENAFFQEDGCADKNYIPAFLR